MKKQSTYTPGGDDLPKRSATTQDLFKVPDGYFEDLSHAITEKISTTPPQTSPAGWITLPRFAIIATILTMVLSISYYIHTMDQQTGAQRVALTYEDLVNSGFVYQLDEYGLYEEYQSLVAEKSGTVSVEINPYGDYLIENHIDEYLIESEL